MKAKDHFSFAIMDFKIVMGSLFEGAMGTPFYEPFFSKFIEFANPKLREHKAWLWIIEDKGAKQVYKMVRKCSWIML